MLCKAEQYAENAPEVLSTLPTELRLAQRREDGEGVPEHARQPVREFVTPDHPPVRRAQTCADVSSRLPTGLDGALHRPSDRPTISFMISVVPP